MKYFFHAASFADWNAKKHFLDTAAIASGMALGIDWLYDDINASLFNIDEVQKDMLFQSINTASFHGDYFGSESSFAALHSDRNDVTHSHLDCGSFVYDAEGVRFASDMGQDNYNLYNYWQTSSKIEKNRWCYYRMRAEGHNTLVINPSLKPDQTVDAHCTIDRFASKTDYGFCIADITDAYRDNAYSVKRGLLFNREDNSCIIRDEIDLKTVRAIFSLKASFPGGAEPDI